MRNLGHDRQQVIPLVRTASKLTFLIALLVTIQTLGTTVAQAQSTGTVDFGTQLQQIDGFGVANPFWRDAYLVNCPAISQQVIEQLFNLSPALGSACSALPVPRDASLVGSQLFSFSSFLV